MQKLRVVYVVVYVHKLCIYIYIHIQTGKIKIILATMVFTFSVGVHVQNMLCMHVEGFLGVSMVVLYLMRCFII